MRSHRERCKPSSRGAILLYPRHVCCYISCGFCSLDITEWDRSIVPFLMTLLVLVVDCGFRRGSARHPILRPIMRFALPCTTPVFTTHDAIRGHIHSGPDEPMSSVIGSVCSPSTHSVKMLVLLMDTPRRRKRSLLSSKLHLVPDPLSSLPSPFSQSR